MVRLNRRRFLQETILNFIFRFFCIEEIQPLPKNQRKIALVYHPEVLVEANAQLPFISTNAIKSQQRLARAERKTKCESKSCQTKKMVLSHARNYQKQKGKVSQLYRAHRDQKEYIDQVTFHLVKQYDTIFWNG